MKREKAGILLCLPLPASAIICSAVLFSSAAMSADDTLEDVRRSLTDVEGASIDATEEEPRVLYIVPWQLPRPAADERRVVPVPEADKLLEPIDLEALQMHQRFRQTLQILDNDRAGPNLR